MNTASARILVMAEGDFACIKIIGRANCNSSIDFKALINELWRKASEYFVLDLSECSLMDSTFLGVLAGFGLKMSGRTESKGSAIELLNPNPRVMELLENLGVLQLFKVSEGAAPVPENQSHSECAAATPSREELARASLEAHRTLMAVSPENAARFKDVTEFLAQRLKQIKTEQRGAA